MAAADPGTVQDITITVNQTKASVPASALLLTVLRDQLGMTGAKLGCGEGACGACAVLVDGEPVKSCQRTAGSVGGRVITTIEGLAGGSDQQPTASLHPAQQAFVAECAAQCGFCTPGMVLATAALLESQPRPDDAAIDAAFAGQICRCGDLPAAQARRSPGSGAGCRRFPRVSHRPGLAGRPG
jgi:aerobic-type carbon monoxide dehydrogenase small subunit (CoxS/CutS family)